MIMQFTNNPYKDGSIVEQFTQELVKDASRKCPTRKWIRIPADENSEYEGFQLTGKDGSVTILQIDSRDNQHMQLSLRCMNSDSLPILTSTESSTEQANDVPLKMLYTLLDKHVPAMPG